MRALKTMLIAVAALLTPAPAMAQTKLSPPPGPWTVPGAAAIFPEKVGEYQRVSVTEFNFQNFGVGYVLDRNGVRMNTITVFVYVMPERPSCQEEFDASAASIMRSKPESKRIVTDKAASPREKPGAALHAGYTYTGDYGGLASIPVRSDLYVYCRPGSEWLVKARTSWPASTDMSLETAKILRAITWPSAVAG